MSDFLDRHGIWPLVAGALALVVLVGGIGYRALSGSDDTGATGPPTSPESPATQRPPSDEAEAEPDRIAVAETPAVPDGAFTNANGTYYSTYRAPAEAMAWMRSEQILFNRPLPADTPSMPESADIATRIDEIVRGQRLYDYGSGIEDEINSPQILLVDSDAEDFVPVRFTPDACGASTWWNWTADDFEPYINEVYANIGRYGIPAPTNLAMSPDDSDLHTVIYDWRRDNLIELWHTMTPNLTGRNGIEVCWGGVIKNFAATSNGVYPFPMGVFAAGTTTPGLTITMSDLAQGEIRHAIGVSADFGIDDENGQTMSYPANRNDGNCSTLDPAPNDYTRLITEGMDGSQNCLYEGQFMRLPPDYDVDALPHPYTRMLARAIRDYGMVLVDEAGCFCPQAESGLTPAINNLSDGNQWDEFFDGTPDYEVLQQIDWTQLQVLPRDWGKPDGYQIACTRPLDTAPEANPVAGDSRCQNPVPAYAAG